jgi:hypothetical protein
MRIESNRYNTCRALRFRAHPSAASPIWWARTRPRDERPSSCPLEPTAATAAVSDDYRQAEARLRQSPAVRAMADGLRGRPRSDLAHSDGTPRHEFMMAANAEYASRTAGSADLAPRHIGAVASALLAILDEDAGPANITVTGQDVPLGRPMDPREVARRLGELGVQAFVTEDGAVALDAKIARLVMQLLQELVDMGGPEALPWLR